MFNLEYIIKKLLDVGKIEFPKYLLICLVQQYNDVNNSAYSNLRRAFGHEEYSNDELIITMYQMISRSAREIEEKYVNISIDDVTKICTIIFSKSEPLRSFDYQITKFHDPFDVEEHQREYLMNDIKRPLSLPKNQQRLIIQITPTSK